MKRSSLVMPTYERCGEMPRATSLDRTSINTLPDGCVTHIFKFLPGIQDRHSCAAVSWRWAELQVFMQKSDFWPTHCTCQLQPPQEISLCLVNSEVSDYGLVAALVDVSSREAVTELSLDRTHPLVAAPGAAPLTDKGIEFVSHACSNLKSISLAHCISVGDRGMSSIASNCAALQELALVHSHVSDYGISEIARKCANLSSLSIEKCDFVSDRALRAVAQHSKMLKALALMQLHITDGGICEIATKCVNLSSIGIVACDLVSDHSMHAIAEHVKGLSSLCVESCSGVREEGVVSILVQRPELATLKLKFMKVGEAVLRVISHSGVALQSLHLVGITNTPVLAFNSIAMAHGLGCLTLIGCEGLQDSSFSMFIPGNFTGLKNVVVEHCSGLTQLGLSRLVGSTKVLETLCLSSFSFASYAGLMGVLALCSETIKSITLNWCPFDRAEDLLAGRPAVECPNLEMVRLNHCGRIGEMFVAWLGRASPQLTEVSLIGMDVTDLGITGLMRRLRLHNRITKIDLSYCDDVRNRSVSTIARQCRDRLQSFVLSWCKRVTRHGLQVIALHCLNLIRLDLSGTDIDDGGVEQLMLQGFEHLEELYLSQCSRITDSSLVTIVTTRAQVPRLARVDVSGCSRITQPMRNWFRRCGYRVN